MDKEILAEFECDLGDIEMESEVSDEDGLACRKRHQRARNTALINIVVRATLLN
jgi:hypothetical protein